MRKLIIAPLALEDLKSILNHIARDKPKAAHKQVSRLIAACERVGENPLCGESCQEFSHKGYHRITEGSYVIFYQFDELKVEVLRVLHGARDWSLLLP